MSSHNGNGSLPAVAYYRRSTDRQEASIDDQRKAVERYAAEKGYKILRPYVDDGISGDDTAKRDEFRQMLTDARGGDFKAILVWDQDRFGRFDSLEAGYWIHPLRQAGVQLVTVNDGPIDWSEFNSRVMYGLKQEGKHQFLQDLSRNVCRGQLEAANSGSWLGGKPYGYRIEGPKKHKRLVLDDSAKVRIVQRIFRQFTEDSRSLNAIADGLNADGIVSPTGRIPRKDSHGRWVDGWRYDAVKVILQNPAYVGDFVAARTAYGKYHSIQRKTIAKGRRAKNPESSWIVRRDHHEPIIDRVVFARAQAILSKGKTGRSPYSRDTNPYFLSCLLKCGRCGAILKGETCGGRRFYECSNRHHHGLNACAGTRVREDELLHGMALFLCGPDFLGIEGISTDELTRRAKRGDLSEKELPRAFKNLKAAIAPPRESKADRKRMEKEAKTLADKSAKARQNLVHLHPDFISDAEEEIRRLETERDELELQLRRKPPTEADINAEVREVMASLLCLAAIFSKASDLSRDGKPISELRKGVNVGPILQSYFRGIGSIVVHTRIEGNGTRARHTFLRGEVVFLPVSEWTPLREGRTLVWPL
jgi:DNA invertase Pin-like site-specific DNA recombinase